MARATISFSRMPGFEFFGDGLVGAVDHRRGDMLSSVISSLLLISRASSMTCWPSRTFEPGLLQLEQHRRLDHIDADRHVGDAGFA